LNHSLSLWLPNYEAVRNNKPEVSGAANFDPVEVCPLLYTTRMSTAKMLIELEEWDSAVKVRLICFVLDCNIYPTNSNLIFLWCICQLEIILHVLHS
jgi:hypothetical protein